MDSDDRSAILIVDDDSVNRTMLRRLFMDAYQVVEARDGEEALGILRGQKFAAVLLDLMMPVLDGFGVLSEMHADPSLSEIPVVVVTARYNDDNLRRVMQLGALAVYPKPFQPDVVRTKINDEIEIRRGRLLSVQSEQLLNRIREQAQQLNLAERDQLTGLYNRDAFCRAATKLIAAQSEGYYVLSSLDVDSFKVINDQYGLEMGDRVLVYIAGILRRLAEFNGGLAARKFADQFALLLPVARMNAIADIPERLNQTLWGEGLHMTMQLSEGRYVVDDKALAVSVMLDRALLAKHSVKGRYDVHTAYFTQDMLNSILEEQWVISEMEDALKEGQFEAWYQPQYRHAQGGAAGNAEQPPPELIGAEALSRWRHPKRGVIMPPTKFISIFERNGFIYELDKYIWEQVCRNLRHWLDAGLDAPSISVNVSRYDVFQPSFFDTITGLVDRYGIPCSLFRVEITESAFSRSTEQIVSVVEQLREYGLTVEIDDFGSAYSSLNTLKEVPANTLKIDMRFLEGRGDAERGGNILQSVVHMARLLGMHVIAEGVETLEQAEFLCSVGCSAIQGFLYAKPMPYEEFEAILCRRAEGTPEEPPKDTMLVNPDAFWNPDSLETLVFNHYAGGACVIEYCCGRVEMLRINEKLCSALGTHFTQEELLHIRCDDFFDAENYARFVETLVRAIQTGGEETVENYYDGRFDNGQAQYIRLTVRLIAQNGERSLLYGYAENMTLQRIAEQKEKRAAEKLAQNNQQLRFILENIDAAITEIVLEKGKYHIAFANNQYYEMLGYTLGQYQNEVADLFDPLDPSDKRRVEEAMDCAMNDARSVVLEYRVRTRDGQTRWQRGRNVVIRDSGTPVLLSIVSDITREKTAEEQIARSAEQLRFLNESSSGLLTGISPDEAVQSTLKKILCYFQCDRVYVLEFYWEERVFSNTYEVCAANITAEKEELQNVPLNTVADWLDKLRRREAIVIKDKRAPDGNASSPDIHKALMAVPLFRDGQLIGCLGVDKPRLNVSQAEHIQTLGDYLAVMLTRRDYDNKLKDDSRAMCELMNDTPGGFGRFQMRDGRLKAVFFNDGLMDMFGVSRRQLDATYGTDLFPSLHPEDAERFYADALQSRKAHHPFHARYRILVKEKYKWMLVFGRVVEDVNGDAFLNCYYADLSEQINVEERCRELLDNLPCGAAIYELRNNKIHVIHVNRRFMEIVGRDDRSIFREDALEAVHPDDRDGLIEEIKKASRENREANYTLRIVSGTGAYISFRGKSKVLCRGEGDMLLYVTYFPVDGEPRSIRQT